MSKAAHLIVGIFLCLTYCASGAVATGQTCCTRAKAAGKECDHLCCVKARKDKKVCETCNPKKEEPRKRSEKRGASTAVASLPLNE